MSRSVRRNGTAGRGNDSLQVKPTKRKRKRRNKRKRRRLDRTDRGEKGETEGEKIVNRVRRGDGMF